MTMYQLVTKGNSKRLARYITFQLSEYYGAIYKILKLSGKNVKRNFCEDINDEDNKALLNEISKKLENNLNEELSLDAISDINRYLEMK